ncbi:class I SAM-dependent methyltransferase [Polluticoccus soli]|uniref:class I SAM-dependent methyltransferase n=1 Tax=Polluticoccus soli TaxID=3034150 RepID=UPI0023E0C31E|nr:class I SAM-dependent methyltransferase [Flavipsychrobacter sp. JY13-12]
MSCKHRLIRGRVDKGLLDKFGAGFEFNMQDPKDYSSISPSAKSLLLMKGYTNIPYAQQTAALMQGPEIFDLNFDEKDFWFWIRVMHFESRYWSIDQLLQQTDIKNILELSSGYSLRGLDLCAKDQTIHYIDTDLPEVIADKQQMIDHLGLNKEMLQGKLELQPLNALDEDAFNAVVSRFDGPVNIVNEGLLMYLNMEEKVRLCQTIHNVLKQRGGCWITADIYVKRSTEMRAELPQSKSEAAFMEQHNVEENKFDGYEAAAEFFNAQGFEVVKEAVPDNEKLSVLPQVLKVLPEEWRNSKEPPPKIQATWMLKAV